MKLLALDAATAALSVAVLDSVSGDHRAYFEIAPRAHAERLLPTAHRLLCELGWTLGALDGIAFGRGPGAFTGLRIAAGFVQGLAAGSDRPVAPVSTLAALAARAFDRDSAAYVRVVQDARMGEVYTADFVRGDGGPVLQGAERVVAPGVVSNATTGGNWACAGNGWPLVAAAHDRGAPPPVIAAEYPHALDIARLGARMLAAGHGVAARAAAPVYVRDDVARRPASEGEIR